MELILKEDVEKLGKCGDVVDVKQGFARNYLIPMGLACEATPQNKKQVEAQRKKRQKKEEALKASLRELAKKIEATSCTIAVKVGEDEKLYGSVTTADIAKAFEQEGITLDKKDIVLSDEVKAPGVYQAQVKLHPEVIANAKIWVVKE